MTDLQSAHFFDRVAAADSTAAAVSTALVYLHPTTGRYVFSDGLIPGWTRAYLTVEGDGRVHLDTSAAGALNIPLYGGTTIQL